jgi:hypothetical protein
MRERGREGRREGEGGERERERERENYTSSQTLMEILTLTLQQVLLLHLLRRKQRLCTTQHELHATMQYLTNVSQKANSSSNGCSTNYHE